MNQNLPKPHPNRLVLKFDITIASVPIFLGTYKYGIFDLQTHSEPQFVKKVAQAGYFSVFHEENDFVITLTEKGAKFVRENFLRLLEELSPAYTFPIIVPKDEIELIMELENKKDPHGVLTRMFHTPSGSSIMYKGIYFVQSVDSTTICVTDDMNIFYRINLAHAKSKIKFRTDQLEDTETELKKRFGVIRLPSLIKRFQGIINTLTFVEMLDNLYEMSYTKDRIEL